MVEIAKGDRAKGVFQKDIAINQSLSNKYLDQIIHSLKRADLIHNTTGKKSGYLLARNPAEITVYDIHRAFDQDICLVHCISGPGVCEKQETCQARDFWGQLNNLVINHFKSVTLEDILNGKAGLETPKPNVFHSVHP